MMVYFVIHFTGAVRGTDHGSGNVEENENDREIETGNETKATDLEAKAETEIETSPRRIRKNRRKSLQNFILSCVSGKVIEISLVDLLYIYMLYVHLFH